MSLDEQLRKRKERLANIRKRTRPGEADTPSENALQPNLNLSYRNLDPETNAPRLGFLDLPNLSAETTVEAEALKISEQLAVEADKTAHDSTVDLVNLAPKTDNWDLKRDMDIKLERLKGVTDAAIARIVRDRVKGENNHGQGDLVEVVKEQERRNREDLAAENAELE
ncbi:Pre-mRNA-splicing factor cwf18 [Neolecta irregularis DAH-3]|uniref:Pre-mRNA-splicing factor cwf18 n=1 Tax=Neolecta irregularis (strain DAH-3) TaxID=1198029 RepID=A0A1U7LJ69_NEOID|nr:Pre-mRNA-splicing factor cwf18 [Neolecta irregularis DAH-3]|eukprot:OLL22571.1 Pre-mRNA-splicing factor cwf18 [Neolecta irregularis DAH-3]